MAGRIAFAREDGYFFGVLSLTGARDLGALDGDTASGGGERLPVRADDVLRDVSVLTGENEARSSTLEDVLDAASFVLFIILAWFNWGQGDLYSLVSLTRAKHLGDRASRILALLVCGGLPMLVPLLVSPEAYQDVAQSKPQLGVRTYFRAVGGYDLRRFGTRYSGAWPLARSFA